MGNPFFCINFQHASRKRTFSASGLYVATFYGAVAGVRGKFEFIQLVNSMPLCCVVVCMFYIYLHEHRTL